MFCLVLWFLCVPNMLQFSERWTCELCTSCFIPIQGFSPSNSGLSRFFPLCLGLEDIQEWTSAEAKQLCSDGLSARKALDENRAFSIMVASSYLHSLFKAYQKKWRPLLLMCVLLHVLPHVLRFKFTAKTAFVGELFYPSIILE